METYVLLAKLTDKGRADIKGIMARRQKNIEDLQKNGIRVVADYAIMGPYDFLYIVEAPDNQTVLRQIARDTGSGRLEFQTMLAVPLDQFEQMTKDLGTQS